MEVVGLRARVRRRESAGCERQRRGAMVVEWFTAYWLAILAGLIFGTLFSLVREFFAATCL